MGVDITHIIRHDFHDTKDREKSLEFTRKTIEGLKKSLHIKQDIPINDSFEDEEISFRLPVYDMEFYLADGFWAIESYYHYCQILMHEGAYFWLRAFTFDLARVLGKSEAWYAAEYYTWNGGPTEAPLSCSFEKLHDFFLGSEEGITEFDQKAILEEDDWRNYKQIYHDAFVECQHTFSKFQERIPDMKLLGITVFGDKYYRVEKDGQLLLVDKDTLEYFPFSPIQDMDQNLNGPEIVIYKDGQSALFSGDGKQLSDFMDGQFEWKWNSGQIGSALSRTIYNETTGFTYSEEQ